jgi:hypothetical protein
MDQTWVAPVYTGNIIHSQICISCHCGSRQICLYFAVRIHFTGVWEPKAPAALRDIGVDIRYISQTCHFFSSNSFASMLCLTVLPFVELDTDKWIPTLLPRQDAGNMRGERKYINDKQEKSNVHSSLWKLTMTIIFWQTREWKMRAKTQKSIIYVWQTNVITRCFVLVLTSVVTLNSSRKGVTNK